MSDIIRSFKHFKMTLRQGPIR